jgi:hypothetical protein
LSDMSAHLKSGHTGGGGGLPLALFCPSAYKGGVAPVFLLILVNKINLGVFSWLSHDRQWFWSVVYTWFIWFSL